MEVHGCMNFCANRGLTCKMYGESSKNRFCTSFQYDPQSAHLHEFSNGFRRQPAGGVLLIVRSRLSQMYSTLEEKSELESDETETSYDYEPVLDENGLPNKSEIDTTNEVPVADPTPENTDNNVVNEYNVLGFNNDEFPSPKSQV